MIKLTDYNFELPERLIAQQPIAGDRSGSRLFVLSRNNGRTQHKHFYDITSELRAGDVLVFNNSKVLPARLFGVKADTGGAVEILLVQAAPTRSTEGTVVWEAMIRWKHAQPGAEFVVRDDAGSDVLRGHLMEPSTTGSTWFVAFAVDNAAFHEVVDRIGHMPIPPYIKHNAMSEAELREKYQTVYAKVAGSVAAPTAGLHFTPELLDQLQAQGVELAEVTLHVGLGTFQPVKTDDVSNHVMHSERISLSPEVAQQINKAKAEGRRVIAVGTTSVRVLESFAVSPGVVEYGEKDTRIFITPGYEFKIVDGMVTNFHLPKSTLLMLVSAFAGRDHILAAYSEAIAQEYRFFSFGDAMLIM